MKRKSIITVLALVLVLALSLSIFSACNKKHKYSSEWKFDEKTHWHECTTKKHTDTSEKLPHEFKEEIVKAADYGVVGEKKFTCKDCGYSYTEDIDALGAKDNEIKLAEGKTLGKEYDGEVVSITKDDFVIEGNRAPTIMFNAKGADDNTYTATAPKKVGEYTVKVSVKATAEWKAATKTFDFAITPMVISVDWEPPYKNSNIFTGAPAELLPGDEFEISNADAFNNLVIGAQSIPDPTTNYVEIGTGYGAKTIFWEQELENGVWSRNLTKEEVINIKTGTFRVHIKYAEGDNYNRGDAFVKFTMKAKSRNLTVKNFDGKTYDGKQVANFTYENLVDKLSTPSIVGGVEHITPMSSGEKYVEFREVGGEWERNLNVANVLTNAGEYEYRIGVTATDEWEAVVSEVKTFTIKPYEFVLKLGYGPNQNTLSNDGGKTFLLGQYDNLIEGQKIQLWLNNEKAGLQTNGSKLVPDQKKKVTIDCFFLKIANISFPVMENYKIVPQSPSVTTVEITVVEHSTTEKSTSGSIQMVQPTEKTIYATVEKGYFQVGQTVEVYQKKDGSYVKVGEATITEIKVGNTTSASGCAIPSDGRVAIVLDKIYDDILSGKIVAK